LGIPAESKHHIAGDFGIKGFERKWRQPKNENIFCRAVFAYHNPESAIFATAKSQNLFPIELGSPGMFSRVPSFNG
jgi:hypothetical protein